MAKNEPDINLDEKRNSILGELDYLNSFIGLAKSFVKNRNIRKILTEVQNDIFIIQANIAAPHNAIYLPQNITRDRIIDLQKQTYWFENRLADIRHFVIPEGTRAACFLHCTRTVARQIERKIPGYLEKPTILAQYFDRLACLLFALARYLNKQDKQKEQPPEYFVEKNPERRQSEQTN